MRVFNKFELILFAEFSDLCCKQMIHGDNAVFIRTFYIEMTPFYELFIIIQLM